MGNIEQNDGTLVFDDNSDPVQDFTDSHTYAKRFAMFRDGTRLERENLPVAQRRNGMRWFETDTWSEWRLINNEWRQSNSLMSRFRSQAMDITSSTSRLDWNGAGASFGVADFDYAGGVFTCAQPGVFMLGGQIVVLPTVGKRVAFVALFFKNGATLPFFRAPGISAPEGSVSAPFATSVECKTGDTFFVDLYANETIPLDVASGMNVLNIARIG